MKLYNNVLLMFDAPASAGSTDVDPLATPVGEVDLSYPILPAANYEMTIAEASLVDNKAQTGKNLLLKWKTAKEARSTKGEVLAAGQVTISQYIGLATSDKYTNEMIKKSIARVAKGAGLNASLSARDVINNPSMLVSKTALVKVAVKQETAEYPEGNEIKGVVIEG